MAKAARDAVSRGIRLFGDLPFYVAPDSAETWAHREQFQLDATGRPAAVAGVPPDYFSATGQLWGNPLYDLGSHPSRSLRAMAQARGCTDATCRRPANRPLSCTGGRIGRYRPGRPMLAAANGGVRQAKS